MIAVALKFLPDEDSAPIIVASGAGFLGEKINEIALASHVPVVKDEALSSTLVKLPIGEEIPETLYKSVAVVFSFLYKLENELKSKRI